MNYLLPTYSISMILHTVIVIAVAIRVIMKRSGIGIALSWLFIVAAFPYAGFLVYLLIGDRRISLRRSRQIISLRTQFKQIKEVFERESITNVDWSRYLPQAQGLDRLGTITAGVPTVCGSQFQLISDTDKILTAIADDVDIAEKSVLMEFYIWNAGGKADEVLEAVIRAAKRGVECRLLIDDLGSKSWWNSAQPKRLRDAGVYILPALKVGLIRTLFARNDLRLHRKIVVIDDKAAWTGSMNMVDPAFFKQDAGVGQWIDAMVRIEGASVVPLAMTMLADWSLETGQSLNDLAGSTGLTIIKPDGPIDIQVIPSGPGQTEDGLLQMMLSLINAAQEELVLTTPYLVPDQSIVTALRGAAGRGVKVSVIVPKKVDSFVTRFASRSFYDDLIDIGVKIMLYKGGLLHTKSITADGQMSMFGTVNLDMRSLWLNYEVTLFVYDPDFTGPLRQLQQTYLEHSEQLDPDEWSKRSFPQRLLENTLHLLSPLL